MISAEYLLGRTFLIGNHDKENAMRTLLLLLAVFIALTACATRESIREDFENSYTHYNDSLRWREFDKAVLFTPLSLREKFKARVKAAKDVIIVDYRIVDLYYDAEKGEANVKVEIDYYTLALNTVKTVMDNQKWIYQKDQDGSNQWRLVSLLPQFK
jgi:hypothetical protein